MPTTLPLRTIVTGDQLLSHLKRLLLGDVLDLSQVVDDHEHCAVQHRVSQAREQLQSQTLLEKAVDKQDRKLDAAG